MKNLLLVICFSLVANFSFAQKIHGIIYVRDGNVSTDTVSMKDLNAMVARLNSYRKSDADYKYQVVSVGVFATAVKYRLDRSARVAIGLDEIVATVFHGAYRDTNGDGESSPDEFLGTVLDTDVNMPNDGWPADQIVQDLENPQYCSADGKVNVNDIGANLAASHDGQYPPTTSTPSSAPQPGSGVFINSGGGSTSIVTVDYDYGYMGSNGTYYIIGGSYSFTVFQRIYRPLVMR